MRTVITKREKPDFAQVYEQEYSYVYNYIYMQVMHRENAEDLVGAALIPRRPPCAHGSARSPEIS